MLNSVGESDEGEEVQQGKAEAKLGPTNNPRNLDTRMTVDY